MPGAWDKEKETYEEYIVRIREERTEGNRVMRELSVGAALQLLQQVFSQMAQAVAPLVGKEEEIAAFLDTLGDSIAERAVRKCIQAQLSMLENEEVDNVIPVTG